MQKTGKDLLDVETLVPLFYSACPVAGRDAFVCNRGGNFLQVTTEETVASMGAYSSILLGWLW
jgi:hypothetical protein